MSDDEKARLRAQIHERHRVARENRDHEQVKWNQLVDGIAAVAEAVRDGKVDALLFLGESAWIGPGAVVAPLEDIPDKDALRAQWKTLCHARQLVERLEGELRLLGA